MIVKLILVYYLSVVGDGTIAKDLYICSNFTHRIDR